MTLWPKQIMAVASVAVVMVVSAAAWGQISRDPDYLAGQKAWADRDWQNSTDHLTKFLAVGHDRATYEVAFWLGTSWCRMNGNEAYGANTLDWGLSFKQMPEAARPAFARELKLCLGWLAQAAATRPNPLALLAAANGGAPSTVKATGKTYAVGGGKGSLVAYPVRMKRPMQLRDLEARLVPRDDPERALQTIGQIAPGFKLHRSKYAILATRSPQHSPAALSRIGERLDDFIEFLGRSYKLEPPNWFLTIYMVPDIPVLRQWADRLHGLDASPATLGYAFENDLSVVAMLSTEEIGTLLHEVYHLMVRGSFASVPQWLDEGMASLYETSTRTSAGYFGEPNWRSPVFREMLPEMAQIRIYNVITSPWLSDEPKIHSQLGERVYDENQQAFLLAYTRLFTLYLQEKKQLASVFNAFLTRETPKDYSPAKDQAVQLLEKTVGTSLQKIEEDFRKWVPSVYDPRRRIYNGESIAKQIPGEAAASQIDRQ